MPPRSQRTLTIVALASAFAFSGCGGGGNSNRASPPRAAGFPSPPCDAPTIVPSLPTPPTPSGTTAPTTIAELKVGATTLALLSSETPTTPGNQILSFDVTNAQGELLTGGSPEVWLGKSQTSKALGPFLAQWHEFTAYAKCRDRSPLSPLPGTYAATIDVPSPGAWFVAVRAKTGTQSGVAVGDPKASPPTGLIATSGPVPAQVGTKAISVKTPVATTPAQAREIDTRTPPSPLHSVSLDQALKNGRATVVVFSTPLLCESRLCGPVTDEVLLASQEVGTDRANFIHVEEFLPGPDLKPPPPTLQNQSPGFKAWGFTTEPWTVIIDRSGIIRARFEGPVTAPQIEAALSAVLPGA